MSIVQDRIWISDIWEMSLIRAIGSIDMSAAATKAATHQAPGRWAIDEWPSIWPSACADVRTGDPVAGGCRNRKSWTTTRAAVDGMGSVDAVASLHAPRSLPALMVWPAHSSACLRAAPCHAIPRWRNHAHWSILPCLTKRCTHVLHRHILSVPE
jgi:hypothetical protein